MLARIELLSSDAVEPVVGLLRAYLASKPGCDAWGNSVTINDDDNSLHHDDHNATTSQPRIRLNLCTSRPLLLISRPIADPIQYKCT